MKAIVIENDPGNLRLFEAFHIRARLQTCPQRNRANSRTFYSMIILAYQDCLYFDNRPLDHVILFLFALASYILSPTISSFLTRFYFTSVYKPYAE